MSRQQELHEGQEIDIQKDLYRSKGITEKSCIRPGHIDSITTGHQNPYWRRSVELATVSNNKVDPD